MSCCDQKDCDCPQNSSFVFGLIIGLVIAAIVAIVIYKNNRQDVFIKLKKQLEKFFGSLKKSETYQHLSSLTKKNNFSDSKKSLKKTPKKISQKTIVDKSVSLPKETTPKKISVILPPELIKKQFEKKVDTPKPKPRVFKK